MVTSKKTKTVSMTLKQAVKKSKKLQSGEKSISELEAISDSKIDYSDIPELTEDFWLNARLHSSAHKSVMSLKIDDDVIDWFKHLGKNYQSHINTVLRAYVETQKIIIGHNNQTS